METMMFRSTTTPSGPHVPGGTLCGWAFCAHAVANEAIPSRHRRRGYESSAFFILIFIFRPSIVLHRAFHRVASARSG